MTLEQFCYHYFTFQGDIAYFAYMVHHMDTKLSMDTLVVECWLRVREVSGSIPSQGPRHTKDVIKWYQ